MRHDRPTTADELLAMPVVEHDWELFRDTLRSLPFSSAQSGAATMAVVMALYRHVEEHALGTVTGPRCGYWLETNPDTVLAPDAAFTRTDRLPPQVEGDDHFLRLAPDLAVETLSFLDDPAWVREKMGIYLSHGTRLAWLVDPEPRTVAVYAPGRAPFTLGVGHVLDGGAVLPAFRLPVAEFVDLP